MSRDLSIFVGHSFLPGEVSAKRSFNCESYLGSVHQVPITAGCLEVMSEHDQP